MIPPLRIARTQVGKAAFENALAGYLSQDESRLETFTRRIQEAVYVHIKVGVCKVDRFELVRDIMASLLGGSLLIMRPTILRLFY